MVMAISNVFLCPSPRFSGSTRSSNGSRPNVPLFPSVRFASRTPCRYISCSASSAAGSSQTGSNENPYEVLGVSPIAGFDMIKAAYTRKRKDAERRGDEVYLERLERAYDKIMMAQLTNRKKGLTFGSFQVSKDIKYADKQPIVPWGPRFSKSSDKDMKINMAISAIFTVWIFIKRSAEYKPLQFLSFVFVYRIFEKLKAFEPQAPPIYTEDGVEIENEGRALRMGKRLLRSLTFVFSCIALSSLVWRAIAAREWWFQINENLFSTFHIDPNDMKRSAYTGLLNLIEFVGQYIPLFLYNNQELIVTAATSIMLYILASYYR